MCEHHYCGADNYSHQGHTHGHSNEHASGEESPLKRILLAFAIFAVGMILHLSGLEKFVVFFIAYLIAGGDVLLRALKNILKGEVFDENFLMSIATLGAFAIKEYPEAVMVMVLYQLGEFLQDKAVEKSRKSITELMDIRPDYANIEREGNLTKISPKEVDTGDIIVVKTGEKIPLDGNVIEGFATVDTSALTGESVPRELKIGDEAISGCINTNGVIKIKVTKLFGESTVSKILELVEHASSKKAKTEKFITKFARYYTPVVVFAAMALAVLPPILLGAPFGIWFERALTFLVISCPCALVISVPLGFFGGIGGASKCGILIKGSSYLEALAKAEVIVFDKTGTLTKGSFSVSEIKPLDISKDDLLKYTAYAENYSSHPIAVSVKQAYTKQIDLSLISNAEEFAGNGVKAFVDGKEVLSGNSKLMKKFGIIYDNCDLAGTVVYTAIDNKYAGCIVISDDVKEDSKNAIEQLKKAVKNIVMLTGDNTNAAEKIAKRLGIRNFFAQLLPSDKVQKLENLIENKKNKNCTVIFVGDGINDAPVLTRADVGIAMGALGSDAAIEAADVVIMDDKPSRVYSAIKIAKRALVIVKQNIAFAIGIKMLFLVLGAMGFITMWGAVFADVGVSVIAVLNSLRTLQVSKFC